MDLLIRIKILAGCTPKLIHRIGLDRATEQSILQKSHRDKTAYSAFMTVLFLGGAAAIRHACYITFLTS